MDKRKILVVDDDDYMRESICETLRRRGYDICAFGDGQSALDAMTKEQFERTYVEIYDYKEGWCPEKKSV